MYPRYYLKASKKQGADPGTVQSNTQVVEDVLESTNVLVDRSRKPRAGVAVKKTESKDTKDTSSRLGRSSKHKTKPFRLSSI